jgi:hypothetical protein
MLGHENTPGANWKKNENNDLEAKGTQASVLVEHKLYVVVRTGR